MTPKPITQSVYVTWTVDGPDMMLTLLTFDEDTNLALLTPDDLIQMAADVEYAHDEDGRAYVREATITVGSILAIPGHDTAQVIY